ncbi:unnamed protein product [Brachionus calyciflorus]|uniref:BZIP domain-containing protein n=1 Tax=Brachionus calyciflorus TaxID=104777 RepID=A0A813Y6P1_9BILA|nr:unnamed protein product [Brachionus calyciflorus]
MSGFNEFEDLDLKNYMDPTALIDTLSPNDMEIWNGYNFFTEENINSSLKDDIKEENIDMDCCFSSICPNDLINSIENNLIKSSIHEEHFDYNSLCSSSTSSSVSPDIHKNETDFDETELNFVPCQLLQEHTTLNNYDILSKNGILSIGSKEDQNENLVKFEEFDSISTPTISASSSQMPSPSQNLPIEIKSTRINPIHNIVPEELLIKTNSVSLENKIKNSILPPSPPSSLSSDSESNQSSQSIKKTFLSSTANSKIIVSKSKNASINVLRQLKNQSFQIKSTNAKNKQLLNNTKSNSNNNNTNQISNSDDDCWPFFVSLSKLPSSGPILLTEEEKRTLIQEGHQVPTQLPLTKAEEKILKKIRRKIKNKISAQESRRKKKEYVDSLEKRMENYIHENQELKRRLEDIELNNKKLLLQLETMKSNLTTPPFSSQNLQHTYNQAPSIANDLNQSQSNPNQFGTLLMVLILFFTVVFGIWSPVISKDQLTNSATCTTTTTTSTTAAATGLARPHSSSIAAVVVATAAAAATVSAEIEAQNEESLINRKSITNFDDEKSATLKRKFLDDDDLMIGIESNNNLIVSQNSFIARSKTGTAVELTKVRPFLGKFPTISKNKCMTNKSSFSGQANQTISSHTDYFISNNNNYHNSSNNISSEEGQIIILNLNNNNNNNSNRQEITKNINNIRVINTNQASTKSSTTKFKVINNNSINQAVIKLSSS